MTDNTVQLMEITQELIQVQVVGLILIEETLITFKDRGEIIMEETLVDQDKGGQEQEVEEGDSGLELQQGDSLDICLVTETLVTITTEVTIEAGAGVKEVVEDTVQEPHSGQEVLRRHHQEREQHQDLVERGDDE